MYVHGNNLLPKTRCALAGAKAVFSVGQGLTNVSNSVSDELSVGVICSCVLEVESLTHEKCHPGTTRLQYLEPPGGAHGGSWIDCEPPTELSHVKRLPFAGATSPSAARVTLPPFAYPQLGTSFGPQGGAERMLRHQLRHLSEDCEVDGCLEPNKWNCSECDTDRFPIWTDDGPKLPDVAQGKCAYQYHSRRGNDAKYRPASYYGLSVDETTGKILATSFASAARIKYHAPEITNVSSSPALLPTMGGPEITITGKWFGRG